MDLSPYYAEQERLLSKNSFALVRHWTNKYISWAEQNGRALEDETGPVEFARYCEALMKPASAKSGVTWTRRFVNWLNSQVPDSPTNGENQTFETTTVEEPPAEAAYMADDSAAAALDGNGEIREVARQVASEVAGQAVQEAIRQLAQSQVQVQMRGKKAGTVNVSVPQGLARMFPTTNQYLVVRKRVGDGVSSRLHHAGNFRQSDVAAYPNLEGWLQEQLVPTWGSGDYIVSLTDASGHEVKAETFSVGLPQHAGALGYMRELVNATGPVHYPQQPLPAAPMPMPSQSADPRLDRFERVLEQLVTAVQQPKEDPRDVLFKKLADRLDYLERERLTQPAPQQPDIMGGIAKLAEAMRPAPVPQQPAFDMEKVLLLADRFSNRQQDGLDVFSKIASVKRELFGDMADNYKEMKEELKAALNQPQPDFLEEAGKMMQAMEMFKQLAQQSGGGDGGTIAAIGHIFSGLPALGKVLEKAQSTIEAQARLREKERQVVETTARVATAATKPEPKKSAPPAVQLPPGAEIFVDALVAATGTRERIRTTLELFEFLGKHKGWDVYYGKCYELAQARDKEALKYVDALLRNLEKRGTISVDKRETITREFYEHWETILEVAFGAEADNGEGDTEPPLEVDEPIPLSRDSIATPIGDAPAISIEEHLGVGR